MLFWWLIICLAVFLIGVTKSGFGGGVGLMIVPMTAIALGEVSPRGSEAALGLLLPLLILGDLIAVYQYRHLLRAPPQAEVPPSPSSAAAADGVAVLLEHAPPRRATSPMLGLVGQLLPGTAVGVVLGSLLLWWFHQYHQVVGALIRIELGIESIMLVSLHWWRTWRGVQTRLVPEPARGLFTGAFAGVSSTLAHAAGPIIAMYLLPLGLGRQLFVGTFAYYFFILNTAKLPAYWLADQFANAEPGFTVRFVPLVVAGALFGFWVNKRLNDAVFTRIVYFITFVLGWYILIDGCAMLYRRWG